MANFRRVVQLSLALALLLGAIGAPRPAVAAEGFAPVAENANFQLLADSATLAFKVVDKRSGYVWHSNLDEVGPDDKLNRTWTAFARSGISIDYLDRKAIGKRASLTNAPTQIAFRPADQGFEATVQFTDPAITVGVTVRLEAAGVSVEVPFASVKEENPDFKLGVLYVYPFLGATREDSIPGYMFIPDGAGSLIRFSATTKAKNMFYGRYYGADLGMLATLPYDPTIRRPYKLSIPVIGMVHGENEHAFISIVEKGASYGEVQAHPAGVTTRFNFLSTVFIYNESYFQATNRSGAGVTALQSSTNAFDVKIHHRFLTGEESDYVGMARSYQQYLVEQGVLKPQITPGQDIGIRLEFLGGEKEKILFWDRSIPMTTVDQMADILADLDVKNPEVVYYAWPPKGASALAPTSLKLDASLGGAGQLSALAEALAARGGALHLYWDPQAALQGAAGYSPRNDLAIAITSDNLQGYNRNKINYYFTYDALKERYAALSRDVFGVPGVGLALDGLGSVLYSDFKRGHALNREGAIQAYQALLTENPGRVAFYAPNDYMFGLMSAYYDMPVNNSGYLYTTDAVPFLPIVLAGYVPVYGPALNFSSSMRDDLLRHVDCGIYPSYFLSYDVTAKILKTSSSWIYTSSYAQWGQEIAESYRWLNGLLGPVKGQVVVSRQTLGEGVVATTYGNGRQIIVNYNETRFAADGVVVDGKNAVIREVAP